ncbi:flavin reductase family protein [Rhodococcus sp. AG1013]|uniref:flavin reductase family protein n=1 Tax=unclassified Rhodococcus (in: high G+C Gram-positive bacteria) TaxID=192944 RepID=UPI000E09E7B7|nr:flavin reductase family protein [Rhodococcus sp. AG1013]RDI32355.1 flavin reductase (DIM6/NTAB) family NADH-FMN oxidoreductase RutF [Rhodococcus sp. AG1013]
MTTATPISQLNGDFRRAFRGHPAGVAIITAQGHDGPVGLTSSSVSSVAVDPPILGFSLQSDRGSAAVVGSAASFLVHLLTAENVALARLFATPGTRRFGPEMSWSQLETGEPMIHGTGHVLRCTPLSSVHAGPATVLTAAVEDIYAPEHLGAPLVYQDRSYHCVSPWTALP